MTHRNDPLRILLIEDSALVQRAILRVIEALQPTALTDVVDNAPAAVERLDAGAYDYVISDFDLKIGTGGDVLAHVGKHYAFYVEGGRFLLMSADLGPRITALGHPLTIDKLEVMSKLRELLTEARA